MCLYSSSGDNVDLNRWEIMCPYSSSGDSVDLNR